MRTSSAGFGPERHFAPVIISGDCRGHILRSAKGFRTFDREDREIGTYPTPDAAVGPPKSHPRQKERAAPKTDPAAS
jgi:hypothetical protein